MSERDPWDMAQNATADALVETQTLLAQMPDGVWYTPARNRITMAMTSLDTARDFLSAARARMVEAKQKDALRQLSEMDQELGVE